MRKSTHIVPFSLLLLSAASLSQPVSPQFEHLSVDQGLAFNQVNTIIQDSRGFMWFGTYNGLDKYDGVNFSWYTTILGDTTSIPGRLANTLFEDSNGDIWTNFGGTGLLGRYDRIKNKFVRYPEFPQVISFAEGPPTPGKPRYLFLATAGQGLACYEESKRIITFRTHDPADAGSLSTDSLASVFIGHDAVLWVGGADGLSSHLVAGGPFTHYPEGPRTPVHALWEDTTVSPPMLWIGAEDGLYAYDRKNNQFTRYSLVVAPGKNDVRTIYCDQKGRLWAGTSAGIARFDRDKRRFVAYDTTFGSDSWSDNKTWKFQEDGSGKLWLCGNMTPLRVFSEENQRWEIIQVQADHDLVFIAICMDKTGTLWFGTLWDGVLKLDPARKPFTMYRHIDGDTTSLSSSYATGICEDKSGTLWVATLKGLNRLDRGSHAFVHYFHNDRDSGTISNNTVNTVIEDSQDRLWVGTGWGLDLLSRKTGKSRRLLDWSAGSLLEDRKHNLWVGWDGGSLGKFDRSNRSYRLYIHEYTRRPFGSRALTEDHEGLLWYAIENSGLIAFDPEHERWKEYLWETNSPNWRNEIGSRVPLSLFVDHSGTLWVGSPAGLQRFNKQTDTFTTFAANERVSGIREDDHGFLWLSTTNGILKFDPQSGEFIRFDSKDGVDIGSWSGPTGYRSRSGEMFFGGSNGLVRFHPDSIRINRNVPPVVITGFSRFNAPVQFDTAMPEKRNITLSYKDNMITFEFAALNYTSATKNEYAYRMVGFDTGWVYCGNDRKATYTNLDPGEYVFRVKGSNNDGIWNDVGTSIAVTVTPPPWKTTWAYLLYFGLAAAGLYGIRRYQLNKIGARHQLELSRMEAKTLREVDEMKSRFFANISHEFRTPLTLIGGPARQLLDGAFTGDPREQYRVIVRNADRLLRLVNQLLDLSRLESGRMKLQVSWCDMGKLMRSVGASFESLAARKHITFTVWTPEKPTFGFADADKFEKMLINLIANAFKFTNEGGEVAVSLRPVTLSGEDAAVVTVTDTGIGIAPEHQQKIFDRFYQVDDLSTRSYEGTGLGLALTKELVQLHGGSITLLSSPGKGSSFTLTLPLSPSAYGPDEFSSEDTAPAGARGNSPHEVPVERAAAIVDHDQQAGVPAPGRPLVMLVEDNADMRAYLRESLERDYEIIEAANGNEGTLAAQQKSPALIISDVMMPGMNGYELCKALRSDERTRSIPVILLTAKAAPREKIEALGIGADDYLVKPFDPVELKARAENLLRQRSVEKEKREKVLDGERARISRDMHDDIGARLTEIGIMTELMKREIADPQRALPQAQKISETVREVIAGISEIIWATSPAHDRLDDLLAYIRQYASKYLETAQIVCRFDFSENLPPRHFAAEERRNAFLVIKESLNNIVKHAHARNVVISAAAADGTLRLCVRDDGCGFPGDRNAPLGNGLRNMRKRMTDIGGTLELESIPGRGTMLMLAFSATAAVD